MSTAVLGLYKRLLRAAAQYPSKKRDGLLVEIKNEFRRHRTVTDPQQVHRLLQQAQGGLRHLDAFVSMQSQGSQHWSIDYGKP
mgnify:FL=1